MFISHSAEDTQAAVALADACKAFQLRPWLDAHNLRFGELFDDEIISAIRDSSVFVLLLTRHSLGSRYVSHETTMAIAFGVPIVPIFLEELNRKSFEVPFNKAAEGHGHNCLQGLTEQRSAEIAERIRNARTRVKQTSVFAWLLAIAAISAALVLSRDPGPLLSTSIRYALPGETELAVHAKGTSLQLDTGSRLQLVFEPVQDGHLFVYWLEPGTRPQRAFPPATEGRNSDAAAVLTASAVKAGVKQMREWKLDPPARGLSGLLVVFVVKDIADASKMGADMRLAQAALSAWNRRYERQPGFGAVKGLTQVGPTNSVILADADATADLELVKLVDQGFDRSRKIEIELIPFDHIPPEKR